VPLALDLAGAHRKRVWYEFEWIVGLHSNIPECCVREFCDAVRAGVGPYAKHRWEEVPGRSWDDDDVHWPGAAYVPCRACERRGVYNPLHQCGDGCEWIIGWANRLWASEFGPEGMWW
jgi:hypothetical protein